MINNRVDSAIYNIHEMNHLSSRDQWINNISPLVKLVITILYVVLTVSFDRYDITGLAGMLIYPVAGMIIAELSLKDAVKRLRIVLPIVCVMGLFNPLFDHTKVIIGTMCVSGGIISMLTMIIKGIFTVFATYILIATTSIDKICYGMQQLHIPGIIITQIMLTYRYITLLLGEVNSVTASYSLRAPGQKGIHYKVWGSLAGHLMLRSIDRAELVYDSMMLRGYRGDYSYVGAGRQYSWSDYMYLFIWLVIIVVFRCFPIIMIVGNLVGGLL